MDAWKGCDDWLQFSNVGFSYSSWALHFHGCDNLKLNSPNIDGIDISSSRNVFIQHTSIGTGDDCIAINGGCSDLNIANIACGPGHGISLGANGALEKVNNVYVKDCSFSRTTNGARIKTWQGGSGRASALSVDYVKYIDFEGTCASEEAIKLDCDQNSGCHNIIPHQNHFCGSWQEDLCLLQ
ncbi:unnamed protein product [Prunus brigantina]